MSMIKRMIFNLLRPQIEALVLSMLCDDDLCIDIHTCREEIEKKEKEMYEEIQEALIERHIQ